MIHGKKIKKFGMRTDGQTRTGSSFAIQVQSASPLSRIRGASAEDADKWVGGNNPAICWRFRAEKDSVN